MSEKNNAQSQFQSAFPSTGFGGADGGFTNADGSPGGFGGTNAVSEIFNSGGSQPPEDKNKRLMVIGGIAAGITACVLAAFYLMGPSDDVEEDELSSEIAAPTANTNSSSAAVSDKDLDDELGADGEGPVDSEATPFNNVSEWAYNVEEGGITIEVPDGVQIDVSRDSAFSSLWVSGMAKDGRFRITAPPPGKIYWRANGEVNEITVTAAERLNISLQNPGSVSEGSSLSWSAGGNASYYTISFALDQGFASVAKSFTSSGTSMTVSGLEPGQYFVRVAGLNLTTGQWEATSVLPIEVR